MSVGPIPDPVANDAALEVAAAEGLTETQEVSVGEPVVALESVVAPESVAAPEPIAARTSAPGRARRVLGLLWIGRTIVAIGLFAAGIALGVGIFGAVRPAPPPVGNAELEHIEPPAVVREFITSLEANDADATRAVLGAAPYGFLAGELQEWGYQEVTDVETLGTLVEGTASSTAIVLRGHDSNSRPLISNLVVQVESGAIVSFR